MIVGLLVWLNVRQYGGMVTVIQSSATKGIPTQGRRRPTTNNARTLVTELPEEITEMTPTGKLHFYQGGTTKLFY
jgi:hypothetical protein